MQRILPKTSSSSYETIFAKSDEKHLYPLEHRRTTQAKSTKSDAEDFGGAKSTKHLYPTEHRRTAQAKRTKSEVEDLGDAKSTLSEVDIASEIKQSERSIEVNLPPQPSYEKPAPQRIILVDSGRRPQIQLKYQPARTNAPLRKQRNITRIPITLEKFKTTTGRTMPLHPSKDFLRQESVKNIFEPVSASRSTTRKTPRIEPHAETNIDKHLVKKDVYIERHEENIAPKKRSISLKPARIIHFARKKTQSLGKKVRDSEFVEKADRAYRSAKSFGKSHRNLKDSFITPDLDNEPTKLFDKNKSIKTKNLTDSIPAFIANLTADLDKLAASQATVDGAIRDVCRRIDETKATVRKIKRAQTSLCNDDEDAIDRAPSGIEDENLEETLQSLFETYSDLLNKQYDLFTTQEKLANDFFEFDKNLKDNLLEIFFRCQPVTRNSLYRSLHGKANILTPSLIP